jgi:molybdopterin molybdotransferase
MTSVYSSWRLIEEVLRENANSVFRALRKPVSSAQLRLLESSLPAKLPPDFIQSLKIHDGLRNSYLGEIRLFDYWALLPVSAIVAEWKTMTNLQAECSFEGGQFKVTPRIKNDAHWRPGWIPFMDADGDKLIIDLDPGDKGKLGQVFKWSNSGSFPMTVLADSFGEWLAAVAEELSKRRFHLDEFGGICLNSE